MNLEKLCQDLIVKKFNSSEVFVCDFKEKKSQLPYGSLHVQIKKGETEGTCLFLTKNRKIFIENVDQHNLFKTSQFKENIAHLILKEFKELFAVSFTPEIYFSNQELVVYNIEPMLFFGLDYSEKQFEIGLSTLAKFHAIGEGYNNSNSKLYNIDEIKILREDPFSEKNFKKIGYLVCKYFKDIKQIYPNTILDDISTQDIEKRLNIIWRNLKDFDQRKKFLVNGNYSYCNLIFDVMNTDCKISDFSSVTYQSPLFDIFQYVSSFSSKLNWKSNLERAKILYYDYLNSELKRINIDISKTFPKEEYEETFELMLPVMKIIFYLKPIFKKEHSLENANSNISCLCSSYFELSEIFNVLNLKSIEENDSVISFEDCYMVFRKLNMEKFQLNSFKTNPQGGRNGFLGEHYDMIIEIEKLGEKAKKKFFLKGVPQSEALQEFAQTVGSFFKETMFYSRYIPLLKEYGIDILDKVVPECYFADEHKYIILDDLKCYGYKTVSPRSEIINEVILGVIEILAKLNASCIILEETIERKTGCKYRLSDAFEQELNEAFFSLAPAIDSHRNAGAGGMEALTELIDFDDELLEGATFKTLAKNACDEQVFFAQPSMKWRNTLCHADFWCKNYMIQFDENRVERVMMIDFQTYRYAPPAQDLMAFIYLNTTKKTREEFMNKWLDFYYEVFAKNLNIYSIDVNNILPRKDFDESCKFYEQFAITQSITHFQIILVPADVINPLLEDQTKVREIFLGSRYNLVKMVWQIDDDYRKRLTESVGELRRCLIGKIK